MYSYLYSLIILLFKFDYFKIQGGSTGSKGPMAKITSYYTRGPNVMFEMSCLNN